MKYTLAWIAFAAAGILTISEFRPKPAAPPPPSNPSILLVPLSIINEADQAKIIDSTNDQDPNVRWEALVLLDKMKSPQAVPLLFEKLRLDTDTGLKMKIIDLLETRAPRPDITMKLLETMEDGDPELRVKALQALKKIAESHRGA